MSNPHPVEHVGKYRKLSGPTLLLQRVLFVALPATAVLYILGVQNLLKWCVFNEQYLGIFFGLVLAATFLGVRPRRKSPVGRVGGLDMLLMVCGLVAGAYIVVFYPRIAISFGTTTSFQVAVGVMALLLTLEAVRRLVGWSLVIIIGSCVLYARFKNFFPGVLGGSGTPWSVLINYLYLDTNSMLSMVDIGATVGLAFILFGGILIFSGGERVFNALAMALMGRYRGGPAKASIIGSSLVGMISGGPVTNVMLVGTITIPLMEKSGFSPTKAAAIEAAASTGGQLMPPVMGIAAFLIAEFLGIPYAKVALAAIIPAVLYYLSLFVQVDLEAGKTGLKGLPVHMLPRLGPAVKMSWIVILPVVVLVYTLFIIGLAPATAGVLSMLAALVMTPLTRENRIHFCRKLLGAIENSGRITVEIGVILAAAGFISGVAGISGLGSTLSMALVHLAHGNLLALLGMTAIASIILGMGVPSVAAYVLVAILVAPALVQMKVLPLAAHLFIFYFAIISNITPPVAVAAFAAAGIAGTSVMRTGYVAMRLAVISYIIPFLFVFAPALVLHGSILEIVFTFIRVCAGCIVLGAALVGFFFLPLNRYQRIVLLLAGAALILPLEAYAGGLIWVMRAFGAAAGVALLAFNQRRAKEAKMLHRSGSGWAVTQEGESLDQARTLGRQ